MNKLKSKYPEEQEGETIVQKAGWKPVGQQQNFEEFTDENESPTTLALSEIADHAQPSEVLNDAQAVADNKSEPTYNDDDANISEDSDHLK